MIVCIEVNEYASKVAQRLLAVAGLTLSIAVDACQMFPLSLPLHFSTLTDRQPTLAWQGDPDDRYRVQVAALIPEGRVALVHDTEVAGTSFRLPAPLTIERAAIKVLISRGCNDLDAQDLNAQRPWFFVDRRRTCAVDPRTLNQSVAELSWGKVEAASRYRLRIFRGVAASGDALTPLYEAEVAAPPWPLPPATNADRDAPRVATVQALCADLAGRPVAFPLK